MHRTKKCKPEDKCYTSYPPKSKCRHCGNMWKTGDKIPECFKTPINWHCRFHPYAGWHEIGCPHQSWTNEQLQSALETIKQSHDVTLQNWLKKQNAK